MKEWPSLEGVKGYLRARDRTVDKRPPPWRIKELRQAGPNVWDSFLGRRTAKTQVRILEAQLDPEYTPRKGRLLVSDVGDKPGPPYWIDFGNFEPVPWWQCSPEKAVEHSAIIARPRPNSRPITIEGRWITKPAPATLWCFTAVAKLGVYCEPNPNKGGVFDPWVYQPSELEIVY